MKIENWQMQFRQALPLDLKEKYTEKRIRNWYEGWDGKVYVSFSGGKDSTVLLHQVRKLYPEVPAVFVDTGLEYPEVKEFVKSIDNVTWLKPKIPFNKVIEKYGYPVISKQVALKVERIKSSGEGSNSYNLYYNGIKKDGTYNEMARLSLKWRKLINAPFDISDKCCSVMKIAPARKFETKTKRKPFLGMMASESMSRRKRYLDYGCNMFNHTQPQSNPIGFWLEEDIWNYINKYNVPYCKIYNMGIDRTGCMFCMFGVHLEKGKNRFQLMKKSHPKQWDYCINKLGCGKVLDFINVDYKDEQEELNFT